jgi:hypothetical protein
LGRKIQRFLTNRENPGLVRCLETITIEVGISERITINDVRHVSTSLMIITLKPPQQKKHTCFETNGIMGNYLLP